MSARLSRRDALSAGAVAVVVASLPACTARAVQIADPLVDLWASYLALEHESVVLERSWSLGVKAMEADGIQPWARVQIGKQGGKPFYVYCEADIEWFGGALQPEQRAELVRKLRASKKELKAASARRGLSAIEAHADAVAGRLAETERLIQSTEATGIDGVGIKLRLARKMVDVEKDAALADLIEDALAGLGRLNTENSALIV